MALLCESNQFQNIKKCEQYSQPIMKQISDAKERICIVLLVKR